MNNKGLDQYKDDDINIRMVIHNDGSITQRYKIIYRVSHRIDNKNHYINNTDYILNYVKNYYLSNTEKVKKYRLNWDRSERGKESKRNEQAKRKQFGFNALNDPFCGCEAHHINKNDVIYIPKHLHRSIWHSVTKSINMNEINTLALCYLVEN